MKALLTVAVLLMLFGAALLVADVGSSALWISTIAIGLAVVVIVSRGAGRPMHR